MNNSFFRSAETSTFETYVLLYVLLKSYKKFYFSKHWRKNGFNFENIWIAVKPNPMYITRNQSASWRHNYVYCRAVGPQVGIWRVCEFQLFAGAIVWNSSVKWLFSWNYQCLRNFIANLEIQNQKLEFQTVKKLRNAK